MEEEARLKAAEESARILAEEKAKKFAEEKALAEQRRKDEDARIALEEAQKQAKSAEEKRLAEERKRLEEEALAKKQLEEQEKLQKDIEARKAKAIAEKIKEQEKAIKVAQSVVDEVDKKSFNKGKTEEIIEKENMKITRTVFVDASSILIYLKVEHQWGGVYFFRNDQCISEYLYEIELKTI